jgi:hypothetical protein
MSGKEIVYFCGAGLPKALETPGKCIPLMHDFTQVMASSINEDDTDAILGALVSLVNAGVFESSCPEADQLASSYKSVGSWSSEKRNAFRHAMMNRSPESIERLLENAVRKVLQDLDTPSAELLVITFGYAINRFFSLLDWNVASDSLRRSLRHQFERYRVQTTEII